MSDTKPTLTELLEYFDDRTSTSLHGKLQMERAATVREAIAEIASLRAEVEALKLYVRGCARCEGTGSIGVTFATGRAESERCPDCQKGNR